MIKYKETDSLKAYTAYLAELKKMHPTQQQGMLLIGVKP
jgi:hypothetical protein